MGTRLVKVLKIITGLYPKTKIKLLNVNSKNNPLFGY